MVTSIEGDMRTIYDFMKEPRVDTLAQFNYERQHVVVVSVVDGDEQEIGFFGSEKDAGAWMQHVYRLEPWPAKKGWTITRPDPMAGLYGNPEGAVITSQCSLEIRPIKGRGPKMGDCLYYPGTGKYYGLSDKTKKIWGVLDRCAGDNSVTFNTYPYRAHDHVSCSGGPSIWLPYERLEYAGLVQVPFWRWWDGHAGGDQGGSYTMTVPLWRWDGFMSDEEKANTPVYIRDDWGFLYLANEDGDGYQRIIDSEVRPDVVVQVTGCFLVDGYVQREALQKALATAKPLSQNWRDYNSCTGKVTGGLQMACKFDGEEIGMSEAEFDEQQNPPKHNPEP